MLGIVIRVDALRDELRGRQQKEVFSFHLAYD